MRHGNSYFPLEDNSGMLSLANSAYTRGNDDTSALWLALQRHCLFEAASAPYDTASLFETTPSPATPAAQSRDGMGRDEQAPQGDGQPAPILSVAK